ncbi:MAG: hypothetical protein HY903_14530 [Deltaproteobacteria bacterium]|nr:hypothetical protein [Deltaproteobacteria bacterium]
MDPVKAFYKAVDTVLADKFVSTADKEAEKILVAAEAAIAVADKNGDPATRRQVLARVAHLASLSEVYIDQKAKADLKVGLRRMLLSPPTQDNVAAVLGPAPKGRRTYIMSTIGFTSQTPEVLKGMMEAGTNIVRLNMGNFGKWTQEYIDNSRKAAAELGQDAWFIADLSGPKIRLAEWDRDKIGAVKLVTGTEVTLRMNADPTTTSGTLLPIDDQILMDSVQVGHNIGMVDGKLKLKVIGKTDTDIKCQVVIGGDVAPGKGVNLPDAEYLGKTITDEDKVAIKFCVQNKLQVLGISFCRTPEDVREVRALIAEYGGDPRTKIVAKIETKSGMRNLEAIAREADGLMVARGDLGVDLGWEKVPAAQEKINSVGNKLGKPVIVATELLPSMGKEASRPTRAEADALRVAVQQGAECVMTAKETVRGDNPVAVVAAAAKGLKQFEREYRRGALSAMIQSKAAKEPEVDKATIDLPVLLESVHAYAIEQGTSVTALLADKRGLADAADDPRVMAAAGALLSGAKLGEIVAESIDDGHAIWQRLSPYAGAKSKTVASAPDASLKMVDDLLATLPHLSATEAAAKLAVPGTYLRGRFGTAFPLVGAGGEKLIAVEGPGDERTYLQLANDPYRVSKSTDSWIELFDALILTYDAPKKVSVRLVDGERPDGDSYKDKPEKISLSIAGTVLVGRWGT